MFGTPGTNVLVEAVRMALPSRLDQWGLRIESVSVQALTPDRWPIAVMVNDPAFNEPIEILFDQEPLQQDNVDAHVNSMVNVVCALIDERLHGKPA